MAGAREAFHGVAANSLLVASWTAVSRITGVGRVVAIGAVLGPTYLGNLFQAAYVLPAFIYDFMVGALFAALLVPPLVRHVDLRDTPAVSRLASSFLTIAVIVFSLAAAAAVLAGPLLLRLFTIGVEDPAVASAQYRAGELLLALMIPRAVLLGIAGTGGAVMNAHGRFALAAAAPVLENIGIMVVMAVTAVVFGTGNDLGRVQTPQLLLLGLGSTAAVALHAGAQWWGAARVGVLLRPRAGWRDPEVCQILKRAVPSLGIAGLDSLRQIPYLPVANRVPGGLVAFQLAMNFANLPTALAAKPVSTVLLPRLARLFHAQERGQLRDEFVRGISLMAFVTIPAATAYLVLAGPIARSISFGAMATAAGVGAVAVSLAALAVGVVGDGASIVATEGAYAMHDARRPFLAMALRTAVSLCGMAVAFLLPVGTVVLVALGLAISAGNVAGAWYLGNRMRSALPAGGERFGPPLLRALAASLLMAGPAYLIAVHLPLWIGGRFSHLLRMLVAAAVGAALFVSVQRLWRSPELAAIVGGMRRKRDRHGAHERPFHSAP